MKELLKCIGWVAIAWMLGTLFFAFALSWDAHAETLITVYWQHDGCGQYEYDEIQVPMLDVKCTIDSECEALIRGAWRSVRLRKP